MRSVTDLPNKGRHNQLIYSRAEYTEGDGQAYTVPARFEREASDRSVAGLITRSIKLSARGGAEMDTRLHYSERKNTI
ncbi:hypothetical protein DTO169C6_3940 [Paecilomyces variotii]|nr:hypothetical protein DTO169C6_3940 [Paecilomyces variotii]